MQLKHMFAKRRICEWFEKLRWRQSNVAAVSHSLAHDIGVPPEAMDRILHQAMMELRDLSAKDEAADARPIINKAIEELAKSGAYNSCPYEEALMEQCLEQLPERDFNILCQFKQGKKQLEIAEIMGTDVDSVRRSLVKTYADLRMKMRNGGGGGDGEPIESPQSEQPGASRCGSH